MSLPARCCSRILRLCGFRRTERWGRLMVAPCSYSRLLAAAFADSHVAGSSIVAAAGAGARQSSS
jgi:hypothetical protein